MSAVSAPKREYIAKRVCAGLEGRALELSKRTPLKEQDGLLAARSICSFNDSLSGNLGQLGQFFKLHKYVLIRDLLPPAVSAALHTVYRALSAAKMLAEGTHADEA